MFSDIRQLVTLISRQATIKIYTCTMCAHDVYMFLFNEQNISRFTNDWLNIIGLFKIQSSSLRAWLEQIGA